MAVYTTINDGSAYFQTGLYTGNAGALTVTNTGSANLQPDWLWLKSRSLSQPSNVRDSSRGLTKILFPAANTGEGTNSYLTSFNTDGFTINTTDNEINGNGDTYVAWQWKANGGTTSSNTDGTTTSTVQANTTAGFSILTYTGTGSSATVGHGLGAVPHLIIVKRRNASDSWRVYHKDLGLNGSYPNFLQLDSSNATASGDTGNFTAIPSSTVFSLGNYGVVNGNNDTYIAYAFTEKQGYSNFSKYTGNGSTDGPFVYTGFKPAWVMIKRGDSTGNFYIYDTERNGASGPNTNQAHRILYANDSSGEVNNSDRGIDMVSNGFKIRNTLGNTNANNGTYLTFAFASNPFVSSAGVPTTAR